MEICEAIDKINSDMESLNDLFRRYAIEDVFLLKSIPELLYRDPQSNCLPLYMFNNLSADKQKLLNTKTSPYVFDSAGRMAFGNQRVPTICIDATTLWAHIYTNALIDSGCPRNAINEFFAKASDYENPIFLVVLPSRKIPDCAIMPTSFGKPFCALQVYQREGMGFKPNEGTIHTALLWSLVEYMPEELIRFMFKKSKMDYVRELERKYMLGDLPLGIG